MDGLIRRNRRALGVDLSRRGLRRWATPVLMGLEGEVVRALPRMNGRVLDAGCGQAPFRKRIEAVADTYESLDVERNFPDQTWVGDVQDMSEVDSERYDAVLCSEVLEHVPRPLDAVSELHRILRPAGVLILTVPFLARLHDEPHDYYRYTRNGLRHLLEDGGFRIEGIVRTGSIFGFLGHQLSTILLGFTWHLPGLRWIAFALNAALVTLPCHWLDRLLGSDKLPLGYAVVAVRS